MEHFTSVCSSKTKHLGHIQLHSMKSLQVPGGYVVVHVNTCPLQIKVDSVRTFLLSPALFWDVLLR